MLGKKDNRSDGGSTSNHGTIFKINQNVSALPIPTQPVIPKQSVIPKQPVIPIQPVIPKRIISPMKRQ